MQVCATQTLTFVDVLRVGYGDGEAVAGVGLGFCHGAMLAATGALGGTVWARCGRCYHIVWRGREANGLLVAGDWRRAHVVNNMGNIVFRTILYNIGFC